MKSAGKRFADCSPSPGVREAPLRERHAAGVEPAVDDLGHAAVRALLARVLPGDLVDPRLVDDQVLAERRVRLLRRRRSGRTRAGSSRGSRRSSAGASILPRLVVDPDVERRAPVALARERPVDVVREEVAEAAFLDVLGQPAAPRGCSRWRSSFYARGADVPGRPRELDQRVVVGAPAERILVAILSAWTRSPRSFELVDESLSASFTQRPAYVRQSRG